MMVMIKVRIAARIKKDAVLLCAAQLENLTMLITNLDGKRGALIKSADLILDLLSATT